MGIEISIVSGVCIGKIDGELTIYTASAYQQTLLEECLPQKGMNLDLSCVKEIDTAGLQLLLALRKHLERTVHGLHLSEPSEPVREALELARLTGSFDERIEVTGV